jgi:hypothetical protein
VTTSDRAVNLTPRQQRAVTLLIATGDPTATARSIGVSDVTLRRWRRSPVFAEALKDAGRQSAAEATSVLLSTQMAAVNSLREAVETGSPAVKVRAARAILELGIKISENDIEERLRALEEVCNAGSATPTA